MSEQTSSDIVVIGSGPAGYHAAIRAAQLGFSVTVIEKHSAPGGTCLNVGCIPSKALLDSSERFAIARHGLSNHGINIASVTLDLSVMMKRKESIVTSLTKGVEFLFRQNRITSVKGEARFVSPREIAVTVDGRDTGVVKATKAVIIATGSAPSVFGPCPVDNKVIFDSTGALSFADIPKRLAIIGAGAIGLELASVWSRLGSQVSVIERMPQVLPGWDEQLAHMLERILTKQNIAITVGASVEAVDNRGTEVLLRVQKGDAVSEVAADRVLVAVGRMPYYKGLGLETIGITLDPKSRRIPVDKKFITVCEGVYAVGDCIDGPMLAHKGFEEGVAVAELLAGKAGHVNYATIPGIVYTWPEAAFVGATEERLKEQGIAYSSGSFPFKPNGRAMAMDSTDGFVKILADKATDAVLGVHILGPQASELIAEAVSVMEFGGSAEDIARTVHGHPTLSEVVHEAAMDVDKRAIHIGPVTKK